METITQMTLGWELFQSGMSKSRIAEHLGKNRETIRLWLRCIEAHGLASALDGHSQSERVPRPKRQVPLSTKQLVWALRERDEGCCGQKIACFLDKEHSIKLSVPAIYAVLAERYTLRSKGKQRNVKCGILPEASRPRQAV